MIKILLVIVGYISLALGIVGIFLPLIPTTPFLLLAAMSFLHSSNKLYNWLVTHRIFGTYINGYLQFRAISTASKIVTMVLLWGVIGTTIIFHTDIFWLRVVLLLIAVSVSVHILMLRTLTKEMMKQLKVEKESY